ncbi:hypothetical protein H0Z60_14375 [Ectothiorhodospiraceae bacterium WFHF3C12]|nr:hypothetical protein [Ectothiorhodospiraceae bacterium WFHF3C12]
MEQPDFQKLISEFNERNQQIWSEWSRMIQEGGAGSSEQLHERNLEMMEKLVGEMLDTEQRMIESWRAQVSGYDQLPQPVRSMTENFCDALQTMLENRRQLWRNWLDQTRKMSPDSMPDLLGSQDGAKQMMKMWEDFYKQLQSSQQQMLASMGMSDAGKKK